MIPCGNSSGTTQVNSLFQGLGADQSSVSTIWLNIETNPEAICYWQSNQAANCQIVTDLVAAIKANGKQAGIYSNIYMWNSIIGSTCQNLDPSIPIWYPHDDKLPNTYDFMPFGVWTSTSTMLK